MLSLLLSIACVAGPAPAELATAWKNATDANLRYVQIAPPLPTPADWQQLAAGVAITRRFRTDDGSGNRVLAMRYIDQSPTSVWLAILDGKHAGNPPEYSEWTLTESPTTKTLYQHLTLPFPVTNRHWILTAQSNTELFVKSGKTLWERSWALSPQGEGSLAKLPVAARKRGEGAIWTPKNRGGWLLVPAGWGTLATYQLETDIGGWIPEELVSRWALSTLASLVDKTARLSDQEAVHYVRGHAPICAPDGTIVPWY